MKKVLLIFAALFAFAACDKEKEEALRSVDAKDKELREYKAAMRYQAVRMLQQIYGEHDCQYQSFHYAPRWYKTVKEVESRREDSYKQTITCYFVWENLVKQIETLQKVDPGFPQYVCQYPNQILTHIYYQTDRFAKLMSCYQHPYPDGHVNLTNSKKWDKISDCAYNLDDTNDAIRRAAEEKVRAHCAQGGVK